MSKILKTKKNFIAFVFYWYTYLYYYFSSYNKIIKIDFNKNRVNIYLIFVLYFNVDERNYSKLRKTLHTICI